MLVNTLENFQGTHILGASRGHLSDRVIFLFSLLHCFYKIWGMLQELVYKTKIKDIHELREHIVGEWDKLG